MSDSLYLSNYLGVPKQLFIDHGIYDRNLLSNTQLFVDPLLVSKTYIEEFAISDEKLRHFFSKIIKLLRFNSSEANRTAQKMLLFKEIKGLGLGYGKGDGNEKGNSIGKDLAAVIINLVRIFTKEEIQEPEIFLILGAFLDSFGPDKLSDLTLHIIRDDLYKYNQRIVNTLSIKQLVPLPEKKEIQVPVYKGKPLLFLPHAILSELPYIYRPNYLREANLDEKMPKSELKLFLINNPNKINDLVRLYISKSNVM